MAGSERFLSPSWYRVAGLKPPAAGTCDGADASLPRSALVHDRRRHAQPRAPRFPAGYVLVATMDGEHTLDSLWSDAAITLGEQAPSQDQVIQLLGQLHGNDLIAGDVPPDARDLFERQGQANRSKLLQWLMNPLALRVPLVDPNAFLTTTLPFVRPLFGPIGGLLWLATVLPALVLAARYWPELTDNIGDRVLPPGNLLLIALIYPVIKLLHELGHGYTTRAHGGEVHELGVMLLVMLPMPYVEVSASAGFRSKWVRCFVGAAGIMVELFIAALALYVWVLVEPGLVRAFAFNVMLTASVSSVLFNGNPLLRYDGYYVLSDAIEVPNLAQRGKQYWSYLMRRYLFGTQLTRDFPARLAGAHLVSAVHAGFDGLPDFGDDRHCFVPDEQVPRRRRRAGVVGDRRRRRGSDRARRLVGAVVSGVFAQPRTRDDGQRWIDGDRDRFVGPYLLDAAAHLRGGRGGCRTTRSCARRRGTDLSPRCAPRPARP